MKMFVFDLVPFEKEIKALDGKKDKITSYGKVIEVKHFDNDKNKPIQKIRVLEVLNVNEYANDKDSYKNVKPKIGISRIIEYSQNSLPNELGIYLAEIG